MKFIATGSFVLFLLTGCADLTNAVVMKAGKESANKLDLNHYGYKNGKYIGLDVGNLKLKQASSFHKVTADDVKVFYSKAPERCKPIGYITIENPNGLENISSHSGLGHFDFEAYSTKYLKKAASLYGVGWISEYVDYKKSQQIKTLPNQKHPKYYLNDMGGTIRLFDAKTHKVLRISAKAYECKE